MNNKLSLYEVHLDNWSVVASSLGGPELPEMKKEERCPAYLLLAWVIDSAIYRINYGTS